VIRTSFFTKARRAHEGHEYEHTRGEVSEKRVKIKNGKPPPEGSEPMKIDLYTKSVLTIIAICLMYLCLGRPTIVPTAQAQAEPSRVLLAGWVDFGGRVRYFAPHDPGGALPVRTDIQK
jgi:hypothetical protein